MYFNNFSVKKPNTKQRSAANINRIEKKKQNVFNPIKQEEEKGLF